MGIVVLMLAALQDPVVDDVRVDQAIKKGVAFLKTAPLQVTKMEGRDLRWDELVLWTFVHAGVPQDDPLFDKLLRNMLATPLERTYLVSLQAMILEELDRVRYQPRLAQCAQFLLDNLCRNGQWGYGDPTPNVKDTPTEAGRADVATGGKEDPDRKRKKPRVVRKITVRKMREGPDAGDNSNSQYAALGLRACYDAGIVLPRDAIERAARWWREAQGDRKDRGRGWGYGARGTTPYASMTAGAAGSLVIYDHMLGRDWKSDRDVVEGVEWITRRFSVTQNPEVPASGPEHVYFYYMYALERLGVLLGTERFGDRKWYPEGANVLLQRQRPDGSWMSKDNGNAVWDTCFAILFLRRATRPLEDVATGGGK